jgi:hypothetical protein
MEWTEFFDVCNVRVVPCKYKPEWSYHYFEIAATRPFDTLVKARKNEITSTDFLKRLMVFFPTDIPIVAGDSCTLLVRQVPIQVPIIAPSQCWYSDKMLSKYDVVWWLRSLIRGEQNITGMWDSYFQYINYYMYMIRTFHALHAYLGDELFHRFYHDV